MTEPRGPEDQTTIEDIQSTDWGAAAPPAAVSPPTPAAAQAPAVASTRRRSGLRWLVALVGVAVVVAASLVVVSLAAGRPATSVALGYMPADTVQYVEGRLDLPGDQRQKLGEFLAKAIPGFDDQSQLEPKLEDVLDRLVRSATDGKQTWTANIEPWFGGQVAVGMGVPNAAALGGATTSVLGTTDGQTTTSAVMPGAGMSELGGGLFVATIKDRAKAGAWLTSTMDAASTNKTAYNGADLYQNADAPNGAAVAITDTVMLGGTLDAVKAAVDTNGKGSFGDNADVKAALATVDRDYVGLTLLRTKAYYEGLLALMSSAQPGAFDKTQIDETVLAMVPAWQIGTARFESDALAFTSASPSWAIGYDSSNHASTLTGHAPPKTIAYAEVHDVGQALTAVLAKFRALPEAKPAFDSFDQAVAVLGGSEAAFGWIGDVALDVAPAADGTIGGGILIQPKDADAAKRFFTTIGSAIQLAGGSSGLAVRTEDHGGTPITIVDFSKVAGTSEAHLPPGYKPEIAWAFTPDVAVIGYGSDFVASVLDAGPGPSLADDARFQGLVKRVGAENLSLSFLDVTAIRGLVEPLIQKDMPADKWAEYLKEYRPYLEHFDALIGAVHKDGSVDTGSSALTVH
jgi:Protein of unknown function (DUF3352)